MQIGYKLINPVTNTGNNDFKKNSKNLKPQTDQRSQIRTKTDAFPPYLLSLWLLSSSLALPAMSARSSPRPPTPTAPARSSSPCETPPSPFQASRLLRKPLAPSSACTPTTPTLPASPPPLPPPARPAPSSTSSTARP